jgi:hypothetical protein
VEDKAKLYTKYPLSSTLIYNGTTVIHYLLGGIGIVLVYGRWWGYLIGLLYLAFSFAEMYLHMPMKVCPNCVYYRLQDSRCISGLNILSRRVAGKGDVHRFPDRSRGVFCPNNLYMASLVLPIIVMIPGLVLNFAASTLTILLVITGLLLFRFFVVFPRIACLHCRSKNVCPQAGSMGVRDK